MEHRQIMACVITIFVVLLCVLSNENQALGQVTFSRDWTPGKRSTSHEDGCLLRPGSAVLYQMIMNEIRMLAACEARAIMNHQREDSIDANQIR